MQLTHGMDCPPGGEPTATALPLPLQLRAAPVNASASAAGTVQQVDFLVSTSTSQPDVRVSMPVTSGPLAIVDSQQQSAVIPSLMPNTWHATPANSTLIGTAAPNLKRQSSHRSEP